MTGNNTLTIKNERDIAFIKDIFPTLPNLHLKIGIEFILNNIGLYIGDVLPTLHGEQRVTVRNIASQNSTDDVCDTVLTMNDLTTSVGNFSEDSIVMLHSASETHIVDYCDLRQLKSAIYFAEARARSEFLIYLHNEFFISDRVFENQMENSTDTFEVVTDINGVNLNHDNNPKACYTNNQLETQPLCETIGEIPIHTKDGVSNPALLEIIGDLIKKGEDFSKNVSTLDYQLFLDRTFSPSFNMFLNSSNGVKDKETLSNFFMGAIVLVMDTIYSDSKTSHGPNSETHPATQVPILTSPSLHSNIGNLGLFVKIPNC